MVFYEDAWRQLNDVPVKPTIRILMAEGSASSSCSVPRCIVLPRPGIGGRSLHPMGREDLAWGGEDVVPFDRIIAG